jgi:hypothetical protein
MGKIVNSDIKKTTNKRPAKIVTKEIKSVDSDESIKLVSTKNGLAETTNKNVKISKIDNQKFIKILATDPIEKFKEIGEKVLKKEVKWVFYATENFVGVHYYLILKTDKV